MVHEQMMISFIGNTNGTVSVIDGERNQIITNIPMTDNILQIAVNPYTNKIYVAKYV